MVVIKPFVAKRARVELIPLIDTFFLLLSFFIFSVFSMTTQAGLQVDLPSAQTAAATQDETLTITVAADGGLFLNQEPVAAEALAELLRVRRQSLAATPLVVINADQASAHGRVIQVLDAARQAELTRVSFQTQAASP